MSRRLAILYKYHQKNLKKEMSTVNCCSLTCDFWCDKSLKSFLCLTTHYFTDEGDYKSIILSFTAFHERHVSARIAKTIQEKLREFDIYDKVVAMTTDGANNMQAIIHHLNNDKIEWLWCIAHRLHLVVIHAFGFWSMKKDNQEEIDSSSQKESTTSSSKSNNTATMDVDDQIVYFDDSLEGTVNRH